MTKYIDETIKIPTSSWAIWDNKDTNDIEFFKRNYSKLHSRVIICGLNRSSKINNYINIPFKNFHTPNHRGDKRLKEFIQDEQLENIIGAYMTDLSLTIETNSNQVNITHIDINNFLTQINKLDNHNKRTIICIGDKTFNSLCKELNIIPSIKKYEANLKKFTINYNNEIWTIYRIWCHSNYGIFQHKADIELKQQLKIINNEIRYI